jgi:hypothetical protein
MKNLLLTILLLGLYNLTVAQCVSCADSNIDLGTNSSGAGQNLVSTGQGSFAMGSQSISLGNASGAFGVFSEAHAGYCFSFGYKVKALATSSYVFGTGLMVGSGENYLINNTPFSLMIGFNSTAPTLFISESPSTAGQVDLTGKVGIGNVLVPSAKLHIRSDVGEDAAILIVPHDWNSGELAAIRLGNTNHRITSDIINGMEFYSDNNFIFNGVNTGFGVEEPKAKVHINGDLLFEQSLNGIIMKSEDGNCWKGTMTNTGELIFSQVDCGTLTLSESMTEQNRSDVFIYPNPSNGHITIDYTGNEKQVILKVNTINGLLINTYKIKPGETKIDITDISDQVVILSTYTIKGEFISTNKILIRK